MNDHTQQTPPPGNQPSPPLESAPESGPDLPPALDELAAVADGLAAGGSPGDPAAEDHPPPAPAIPTAQLLEGVLGPLFDTIAPAWKVTRSEVQMLGVAYGALLDKYFPGGMSAWGPELTALLATVTVFGPRWNKPRVTPPPEPTDQAPPAGA